MNIEQWVARVAQQHGGSVQVVARCGSFYHLLGLLAFMDFLVSRGLVIGTVEVATHTFLGRTPLTRVERVQDLLGIRFRPFQAEEEEARLSLRKWLGMVAPGRRPAVLFCSPGGLPLSALASVARRFPTARVYWCLLEEGTGSYSDLRARRAALSRQRGAPAAAWSRLLPQLVWERVLVGVFGRIQWFLFHKSGGKFLPQPEVVKSYGHAIRRLAAAMQHRPPVVAPDTVLFLSQPVVELGVCSAAEYLAHLDIVRRELAPTAPFRIKAHPFEDASKFDPELLLDDDLPVEVLALAVGDRLACIAGLNSTALYTVPLLCDVPTMVCDGAPVAKFIASAGAGARAILQRSVREWRWFGPRVGGSS